MWEEVSLKEFLANHRATLFSSREEKRCCAVEEKLPERLNMSYTLCEKDRISISLTEVSSYIVHGQSLEVQSKSVQNHTFAVCLSRFWLLVLSDLTVSLHLVGLQLHLQV